jgi:peptide/nickel transport system substrate-binding protein
LIWPYQESLIYIDPISAFKPGLALSWEVSPDAKTWTFKLRRGVQFSGGFGEFTAPDVINSIALLSQEGAGATDTAQFRALYGKTPEEQAKNILTPDSHTVVFKPLRPAPDFDANAAADIGNLVISSKAQLDKEGLEGFDKKPAGTGPFELDEYTLGRSWLYKAKTSHYRKVPEFAEYRQIIVGETATRLAMLLSGEADMADVGRNNLEQATARGMKVVTSNLPGLGIDFMFGGVYEEGTKGYDASEPFLDVRLREAINRAIDRKSIFKNLFDSQGELTIVRGFHRSSIWNPRWDREFDSKYGYDPARAKAILEEIGRAGMTIRVVGSPTAGVPEIMDSAEVVALQLGKVGLKVKLESIDPGNLRTMFREKAAHGMLYAQRVGGPKKVMDGRIRGHVASGPEGSAHFFENKFLSQKYEELISDPNPDKRRQVALDIGDHLFDQYAFVPLVWPPGQLAVNPKVVAEYIFPGKFGTHIEYIKRAQ